MKNYTTYYIRIIALNVAFEDSWKISSNLITRIRSRQKHADLQPSKQLNFNLLRKQGFVITMSNIRMQVVFTLLQRWASSVKWDQLPGPILLSDLFCHLLLGQEQDKKLAKQPYSQLSKDIFYKLRILVQVDYIITVLILILSYHISYKIMKRRVVITGMGMVSPLAHNLPDSWNALISGKSGIRKYINDPKLNNQKPFNLSLVKDFQQKKYMIPHASSRQNAFAVCATQQSISSAQLNLEAVDRSRVGICLGVIGSNLTKVSQFSQQSMSSTFQNINRLSLLHLISSIPTGVLSVKYKTSGPSLSVNTACASGLSAVVQAAKYVQYDQADVVIAGGVEDSYNPIQIYSSLRIQAMTGKEYQKPQQASRPFDKLRSGFVLGQGCGILIVQELNHAIKRKAPIFAEILSYGQSSDGHHLVKPIQSGVGQMKAIQQALSRSGINKSHIGFVDCHATSTPAGDEIQANTIKQIFSTHNPYVCANKSAIGHTLGAAGALQLIFAINSMNTSILPAIQNLNDPDVEGLNFVRGENKKVETDYFLKNSFGFGGINVCAVLGKYKN